MDKLFHKPSEDHGGMEAGTAVRLIKDHSEVGGSISAGSDCTIESIIHFPTRYRIKDENSRIWTVPIHSVVLKEEIAVEEKEEDGEADHSGE